MSDKRKSESNVKSYIDIFLLFNLFLVIISSFFFIFSLIMEINGKSNFLNFFRRIWEPIILPSITILISSSIISGTISWLKRKLPAEAEDI